MKQSDIYKLHQKYSHGKYKKEALEIGWTHSLIVKNISMQIAEKLEKDYGISVDKKLIDIGALIHDIGFYDYFDDDYKIRGNYVEHGKKGYEILIKEGISQKRARFALTHVGVGIEKNIPISLEEEIVCYADNFHSKGHPRFNTFEDSLEEMNKFSLDNGVIFKRFKDKFGIPDLEELKKKYKKWHQEINEWVDGVR
jgi:putative nucleotidyltransferase with HDIG domain